MLPKNRVDNNRHAQKSLDKAIIALAVEEIHVKSKGSDKGGQFVARVWKFYYCLIFLQNISLKFKDQICIANTVTTNIFCPTSR